VTAREASAAVCVLLFLLTGGMVFPALESSADAPPNSELSPLPVIRNPLPELFPPAEPSESLPPLQGHRGPELYSISVGSHRQLSRYLAQFSTPEGKRWLQAALTRGKPYIAHIARRIEWYGLPEELLFLPIIESEYKPYAVSRSGAGGLWQFMGNSISPFDIRITSWIDERRDFWKATEGALLKLQENHRALGGDWLLALAAYNCGLGRVKRAMAASGCSDFWSLAEGGHLPKETLNYVPKFLAIASICSYPGRNGLPVSWETQEEWERIRVVKPVDIRLLADAADVPLDILKAGNAELIYWITPPDDRRYFLKVPRSYSDSIERVLSSDAFTPLKFAIHAIKQGDTLYDLARHYGVSVSMIQSYNPGINPSALRIGARIVIPMIKDTAPYQGKAASASTAAAAIDLRPFTEPYVVAPGDTWWAISRRYGTTPDALAAANGLTASDILHAGRVILVPSASSNRGIIDEN